MECAVRPARSGSETWVRCESRKGGTPYSSVRTRWVFRRAEGAAHSHSPRHGIGWPGEDVEVAREHGRSARGSGVDLGEAETSDDRSGARAADRSWHPGSLQHLPFAQGVQSARDGGARRGAVSDGWLWLHRLQEGSARIDGKGARPHSGAREGDRGESKEDEKRSRRRGRARSIRGREDDERSEEENGARLDV